MLSVSLAHAEISGRSIGHAHVVIRAAGVRCRSRGECGQLKGHGEWRDVFRPKCLS